MNVTDRVCNQECMREGDVHEFIGPVKIVLVDPPEDQYRRRKAGGAAITLANVMMGANTFCVILFCFGFHLKQFINIHILLCTVGLQLCMPYAILMLNSLFGAAAPMKQSQRRLEHAVLQILGMCLYITGSILAIVLGEKSPRDPPEEYTTVHFFAGCVAAGFAGLCLLTGPCLLCSKKPNITFSCFTYFHRYLGIVAFIGGSVCFVTGIIKPTFQVWLYILGYMAPSYMIVFCCAFYTLTVLVAPLSRCCKPKTPKCTD